MEVIVNEIDSYKTKLFQKIERAESLVVQEMTDNNNHEERRLESRRSEAEIATNELQHLLSMAATGGTDIDDFILDHLLEKTEDKTSKTLRVLAANDYQITTELTMDNSLLNIFNSNETLLTFKTTKMPIEPTTTDNSKTQPIGSSPSGRSDQPRAMRIKLLKTVDLVEVGDNNESFVSGLDFLPDGRIVAVDRNNWTCFIISDSLKISDTVYKFQTYPRDVTCYSAHNVAVTVSFRNIRTICLLTVDSEDKITLMKTLTTSTFCFSICPLDDQRFMVSTWDGPRPARMIDVDGKESDFDNVRFPGKTYKKGECKCTYIPSRDTLVLTDRHAHMVYMYNILSGTTTEVKDDWIQEPKGTCVCPDDLVFVCSKVTHSLVQISPVGDILASCDVGMNYPYAVAVSTKDSRMIVSNSAVGEKKLKLFEIVS